jgi:hypothetical protein
MDTAGKLKNTYRIYGIFQLKIMYKFEIRPGNFFNEKGQGITAFFVMVAFILANAP